MRQGSKAAVAALVTAVFLGGSALAASKADFSRPAAADWPMPGGDWDNSRYSTLKAITPDTVKTLGGAWTAKIDGNSRSAPVVIDGRLFVTAGTNVYAFDPKTGAQLWAHKTAVPLFGLNKGVAVGDGLVFVGLGDGRLEALKADTGELAWIQQVGEEKAARGDLGTAGGGVSSTGQFVSAAPAFINGVVIAALSGGDFGNRGRVAALDAKTGKQLWKFDTIPGPGEFGHDSWPADNEEWKKGGGAVWMTPVIDAELGLVLFGVGNPVPQWGGELRTGDNLFTDSVVALDLKTGQRRWHRQLVHHDIWEQDIGTPLVLYDAKDGAKSRKGVAIMRTDGYLFLLDRKTGEPIFPVEEKATPQNARLKTAPTQPFPVGADQLGPRCVDPDMVPAGFKLGCSFDPIDYDQPNTMIRLLTARAAPMAYSPEAGQFYVTGGVGPFWIRRMEDPRFFGVGSVPGMRSYGIIAAFDAKTNKIAWQKELTYSVENGSGMLATAGGVGFHGEPDGQLQAWDLKKGELVWQFQTGSAANGPASTYQVDGEQYVALVNADSVWAFKLGGTVPPRPAPPAPPTVTSFRGRVEATDKIQIAAPIKDMGLNAVGERIDENAFKPQRAKVKAGTKVTWTNTGKEVHDATALDGSWTTGPIEPGATKTVTFAKPGVYTYVDKAHPWAYAELTVE